MNGSPVAMASHEAIREEQRREAQRLEEALQKEAAPVETPPRLEVPPQPAEVVPQREEPEIDSRALLESSGLVMIETDRNKRPASEAPEEPEPQLGRPRRERAKPPTEDELQQVETRK